METAAPVANDSPVRFRWLRWLVWLGFGAAWTQALLMPMPVDVSKTPAESEFAFWFAKTVHVSAYAFFVILTGWLRLPGKWRWLLLAFVSLHAMSTEFFQQFVRGEFAWQARHPSVRDVLLDHGGMLLGLLCSWRWWKKKLKIRN